MADALLKDLVKKDSRGAGAIATVFAHPPEQVAQIHGANIFVAVGELDDPAGDQAAVIHQLGRPVRLVPRHRHQARQRSQGGLDSFDQFIHTP